MTERWRAGHKKVISGKPYWYLREMGWVDGKPKLVSERYLGTAADIEALLDAREAAVLPERTRHLAFGDVAAAWGMLAELGVAGIIDEAAGARRADAAASAAPTWRGGAEPAGTPGVPRRRSRYGGRRHRRRPVHQSASVLDHRRSGTRDAVHRGNWKRSRRSRCGSWTARTAVGGAGHDELRDLHPLRERQGADRERGKANRNVPNCGWSAWAWSSPGTAGSADLGTPYPVTATTSSTAMIGQLRPIPGDSRRRARRRRHDAGRRGRPGTRPRHHRAATSGFSTPPTARTRTAWPSVRGIVDERRRRYADPHPPCRLRRRRRAISP